MNASIRSMRFLPAVAVLLAGCGSKPASIDIEPKRIELGRKGEPKQLTATVKNDSGEPIEGALIEWASGDAKIATVDAKGLVSAVSTGTTPVTAKAGEASSQTVVSVIIPAKVTVDPPELLLRGAGTSQEMSAIVVDDKGKMIPAARLEWTIDNPAVATVKDATVTAVADGAAKLTAKLSDAVTTVNVVVKGPQPTTIQIDPSTIVLKAGRTQSLVALVYDDAGQPMTNVPVSWSIADPAIAQVDPSGVVTGLRRGDTRVVAAAGAARAEQVVSVK